MKVNKDKLTQHDMQELMQVFVHYYKIINKVPGEQLGWTKRQLFNRHKQHINKLNEEFEKCLE